MVHPRVGSRQLVAWGWGGWPLGEVGGWALLFVSPEVKGVMMYMNMDMGLEIYSGRFIL